MQRLPKLDPGTLAGRKREVYDTIAGGPRGGVRGPFVALLQCPDIADYVQGLGAHLRFEGALPGPLRELAILMTARFWTAAYEWCAHVTIAEKEGLALEVITAISDKKTPEFHRPRKRRCTISAGKPWNNAGSATPPLPWSSTPWAGRERRNWPR